MIQLKELYNRVYQDKDCTGFEYACVDDGEQLFEAKFRKNPMDEKQWRMEVVFPRKDVADSQVYGVSYILPKTGMALELICAIGLRYFQLQIKEEVQLKSNIDFAIGHITEGM